MVGSSQGPTKITKYIKSWDTEKSEIQYSLSEKWVLPLLVVTCFAIYFGVAAYFFFVF